MSRGRWNMLAALIALGLVLPACRHKPPVLKPRRVDEPKPPPAAARDETGPPAAAAEDKRPEPEAVSSAPATAAETACAELEKIARVQSFVATYELWRVGMEGRIPFELAYARPDKCRLVVNHPRVSVRYYSSGGKVYAFAPDGEAMVLDFAGACGTVEKAMSKARKEREALCRAWGWEVPDIWGGFGVKHVAPEFQIKMGRSGDPEHPYTLEAKVSFSTKQETVSFGWLAEPRSWKNARVERSAGVVRFLSPDKVIEVDARNATLVRISMLEGDRVGGGVERKSLREETLPDSAFEPSPEDRLRAEKSSGTLAGGALGVFGTTWVLGPLAVRLPDDPGQWPPEGRKAIEAYLAAVWRGLLVEALDPGTGGWSARFAKDLLEDFEKRLGRPTTEQEVGVLQGKLVDSLSKVFDAKIREVLKAKEQTPPDISKTEDKSTALALMSYNAMRQVVGAAIAKDVAEQMRKLLRR